jgi:hypothetical protein
MNPVGSGARALDMVGAFIAGADDATAGSWNPGGLIQLEPPKIYFGFTLTSGKMSSSTTDGMRQASGP